MRNGSISVGGDPEQTARAEADLWKARHDRIKGFTTDYDSKETPEDVKTRIADASCTFAIEEVERLVKKIDKATAAEETAPAAAPTAAPAAAPAAAPGTALVVAPVAVPGADSAERLRDLESELDAARVELRARIHCTESTHALRVKGTLLELQLRRKDIKKKFDKGALKEYLDGHEVLEGDRRHLAQLQENLRPLLGPIKPNAMVVHLELNKEMQVQSVSKCGTKVTLRGYPHGEVSVIDVLLSERATDAHKPLQSRERKLREELRPHEERVRAQYKAAQHSPVDEAEEWLKGLKDEVLKHAHQQGPALERTASDLSVLPDILHESKGVELDDEERARGIKQLRECMSASQQALGKMHEALVQLIKPRPKTSRAAYLQNLEDLIGPKPPHDWNVEWDVQRKEFSGKKEGARIDTPDEVLRQMGMEEYNTLKGRKWDDDHAKAVALLRTHRRVLGRALREKDSVYAASTYALCEALYANRPSFEHNASPTKMPELLYMHRTGADSLTETEPLWANLENMDTTGFRGLTSLAPLLFRRDPKCFTPTGFAHRAKYFKDRNGNQLAQAKIRYEPRDSDVIAIESRADDELGAHAAIMISDDAAVFPPNTLFCLKEIKASGDWEAPVSDEGYHPNTKCEKSGENPIVGSLYSRNEEKAKEKASILKLKGWNKLKGEPEEAQVPSWKTLCQSAYDTLTAEEKQYYDDGKPPTAQGGNFKKYPDQRLLICTATYREPVTNSADANSGGKMCASNANLQYGSRSAYIKGLHDLTSKPVLTLEMEFTRDMKWTDFRGKEYSLLKEWKYVNGPAKYKDVKEQGPRDEGNANKTPADFRASANGFILSRRREQEARRDMEQGKTRLPEEAAYLTHEEVLAVRLYTGPAFQPINSFLRQIANLSGEHRDAIARHAGLTFAATVGHLISAIRKLAAVATEDECKQPLWRGVRGVLPRNFWTPDESGRVCAVDMAFMSTSRNMNTPIDYMVEGEGPDGKPINVLWALKPKSESDAAYHRGADISRLSQYAWEDEVLFPPCTMLEVLINKDWEEDSSARPNPIRKALDEKQYSKAFGLTTSPPVLLASVQRRGSQVKYSRYKADDKEGTSKRDDKKRRYISVEVLPHFL